MKYNFKYSTKLRVRYGETDQMGYCYYGNYAQYFEVGRVEALRSLGISYKELEDKGVMLPVSQYSVNYKLPALYDEELEIITVISEVRGPRITFDYKILNATGKTVAEASTTLVFVLKETMRPTAPPDFFMELIRKFEDSAE
ncbi:MAG: acyl-CoA thioesterase [Crocinitomicaceae bacterium]